MPPIDLNGYPSLVCLYLWMKIHPEFAEAMKEAEFAALAWWEDVGQAGLSIPKFNRLVRVQHEEPLGLV